MNDSVESGWSRFARRAVWTMVTGFLAVAAFVTCFFVSMRFANRASEVSVPDIAGMTEEDAARATRTLGLVVEVADHRHDPATASGRILEQRPMAGASVRRGRRVKVVVSLGGEILRVPELVGQGVRTAEVTLRRGGFAPGVNARAWSGEAAAGLIVAQVPPADSPAVHGTRVHRLVSDGPLPARWVMPDLTGRDRRTAERWIDASGFRKGPVRTVDSGGAVTGTIVGQLPLAGYPILSNGVVELAIAN